jgi:hypothetical protein
MSLFRLRLSTLTVSSPTVAILKSSLCRATRRTRNLPWNSLGAVLFLLILTIAVYWKLTVSARYTWLESPDMAFQVRPWLDFEAREFHAGRFPLWDPYLWGGQSLIGQVQPGITNPLNWLLFLSPLREGHIPLNTLHWYWVMIHWLGAIFCYALCRDLGASFAASLLGGASFGLTGFLGHTDWPQVLMTDVWPPLVLLFFARVFRGEQPIRNASLCGAALGAAFLSGHHAVPVFTALLVSTLWLWSLFVNRRDPKNWASAGVFVVASSLIGAFQVVPAIEYGRQAVRWTPEPLRWGEKVPYSVLAQHSLSLKAVLGTVIPDLPSYVNPFVGVVVMTLAVTALCARWHSRNTRLLAAVALGGLLLALGANTPVHRAMYALIPMIDTVREPAMAVSLSQLGIAALAALGFDCYPLRRGSKAVSWALIGFSTAVFVSSLFTSISVKTQGVAAVAILLAWVLYAWHPKSDPTERVRIRTLSGSVARAVILLCFGLEALVSSPRLGLRDRPGAYLRLFRDQEDLAEFLKRQPGWFRIEANETAVPYNFGDWFGIEQFGGYVTSMPEKVFRNLGKDNIRRLFGVEYLVADQPSNPAQIEIFRSRTGLKVYRDRRIHAPLWSEHGEPCAGMDQLHIVTRTPGHLVIDADMACRGRVVTGEPRLGGWRAWIDRHPIYIQEFEGVVRAVDVGPGHHRLEFHYHPSSVYWGAGLTAFGILLVSLICGANPSVRRC